MSNERAKIGDTFVRVNDHMDERYSAGDVAVVKERHADERKHLALTIAIGSRRAYGASDWELLESGHWRRVPPGYVVPTHAAWVADVEKLLAARDKMAADPETGTKGVMQCIDEMARLAGIEVAT